MPRILSSPPPTPLIFNLPQTSLEPMVSYYNHKDYSNVFSIKMHLYVATGSAPVLDTDIDAIKIDPTQAGDLKLRQIKIRIDPVPPVEIDTYTLWQMEIEMEIVKGDDPAQGLRIMFVKDDPETTRGTVTTVSTTLSTPH